MIISHDNKIGRGLSTVILYVEIIQDMHVLQFYMGDK